MRVLIFGTGKYYLNRKKLITDDIVAFIDNKVTSLTIFEDKKLFPPSQWKEVDFDVILLMSANHKDMKTQLIELGVEIDYIWSWDEYCSRPFPGRIDLHIHNAHQGENKVLVFTESLNYNGGSMTAVYAAMALKQKGYDAWLAGGRSNINDIFLSEVGQLGINVAVIYDCPYLMERDICWIKNFDIVIVNVFQMLKCACDISVVRPVLWWLHEPDFSYGPILERFSEYHNEDKLKKLHIVAVSDIAKECFERYFPTLKCGTMVYGIPDEKATTTKLVKRNNYVFAVIGYVSFIKGQDIFLKASKLLEDNGFDNLEFWIIGTLDGKEYSKKISRMTAKRTNVKIFGYLNRKEMRRAFSEIDVVVSTSREDTMSIVLTEGMMHSKICISSDSTGMAKFINDGENGFVFESENIEAAYKKMKWVYLHRDELDDVRKKARATYEKYFSIYAFGDRLEKELLQVGSLDNAIV